MKQEYNRNLVYRFLYLFIGFYRFVGTVSKEYGKTYSKIQIIGRNINIIEKDKASVINANDEAKEVETTYTPSQKELDSTQESQ